MQKYKELLRKILREFLGVTVGSNAVFTVKPLERDQRWTFMIGYCLKDLEKPHFKVCRVNVTNTHIVRGRADYLAISITKRRGLCTLTPKNYIEKMAKFWMVHLRPVMFEPEVICYYLYKSGEHVPDPKILAPRNGGGVNADRLRSWFKVLANDFGLRDIITLHFEKPSHLSSYAVFAMLREKEIEGTITVKEWELLNVQRTLSLNLQSDVRHGYYFPAHTDAFEDAQALALERRTVDSVTIMEGFARSEVIVTSDMLEHGQMEEMENVSAQGPFMCVVGEIVSFIDRTGAIVQMD